jgi:coatomer protein complex subunit alpha (xenin)
VDGGSYEPYIVPKDTAGRADYLQDTKKGVGDFAVFIAQNRFAVLKVRYIKHQQTLSNE